MSDAIEQWLKSDDSREYFELLAMPTVGADPLHLRDCVTAATWLKRWLDSIGAEAELVLPASSSGVPVVFAERRGAEGAPTILVYGHYDVQPADPLDAWATPPFEPTVKGERVYCRGAQDDKGQFFAFLCGVRRVLAEAGSKAASLNFKFILEGEEESGSGGLTRLLDETAFRRRLAADVLLVCDTSAAADLRPAIVAGLRGVAHFTLTLTAANRDLHSGEYGGIAPNAAQGLSELLASLHNPDGSISVAGFRDGIVPPTHEELTSAEAGIMDESQFREDIGTEPCGGQLGKSVVQRNCFEPTIEINGVHSGYGGPGAKTVIPCSAVAKISMRFVPGQDPVRCFDAVRSHLQDRCPKGMKIELSDQTGGAPGFRLPLSSPIFRLAEGALGELDPRGAVYQWDGASIPVVSAIQAASGAAPLLVGWGQGEDRIHSPNESYSVRQFTLARTWAERIVTVIAESF